MRCSTMTDDGSEYEEMLADLIKGLRRQPVAKRPVRRVVCTRAWIDRVDLDGNEIELKNADDAPLN